MTVLLYTLQYFTGNDAPDKLLKTIFFNNKKILLYILY